MSANSTSLAVAAERLLQHARAGTRDGDEDRCVGVDGVPYEGTVPARNSSSPR